MEENIFTYRNLKTSKFIVGKLTEVLKSTFLKVVPCLFL